MFFQILEKRKEISINECAYLIGNVFMKEKCKLIIKYYHLMKIVKN